ncbi:class I SAM-dependent DNA methyltransferase [Bacillus piscicola]|uniref:class I SAM-dependent DNA methyltransferase n=1 Tax=Bacillus piscicola TaxID=1632684 RepID=UPI001F08BAE1|nr:class I SAM-dependent methyltransferase [Bacillus piscicola]
MAYTAFAQAYDQLMEGAPYDAWTEWVIDVFKREGLPFPKVLEAGCGTGTILELLLGKGFQVDGLDLSEEMLAAAEAKLNSKGLHPLLMCQDMRYFDIGTSYDVILVLCDSLNYLTTESDVEKAFLAFHRHLTAEGLLVFDVHSLHYIENILAGVTIADAADDISYIWKTFLTDMPGEVEHELTLFLERQGHTYERYDELHTQRTFSVSQYNVLLEKTGFTIQGVFADFTFTVPTNASERIFFVAKKLPKQTDTGYNKDNLL